MSHHPPARIPRLLLAALSIGVVAFVPLGGAAPASAAVVPDDTLVLTAEPASVSVGDTVTVTVSATGLTDLYAYDLDVAADPELLAFVAGSGTTPAGGFGSATGEAGTVSVIATRLGTSPGLVGDQTLVTLSFTALTAGTAEISLAAGSLVDSAGAATPIDTSDESLTAAVEITGVDDAGADAQGAADGAGNAGSGGTDGSTGGAPTSSGSLAITGADAAPWLIAAGIAAIFAAAGAVLAMRRRTR